MSIKIRWIATLIAAALVLGCTADEEVGVSGNGSGGFGTVGRVDGFGSAIIEGDRLDDSTTSVTVDENPARPSSAPLTSLGLGAQVIGVAEGDRLARAATGAEVIGYIDEVAPSVDAPRSLRILGQRIVLDHPVLRPAVDGFPYGDLRTGRIAEVHGVRLANGDIVATRIEQRSVETPLVRLAGTVRQLDTARRSFRIGDLAIDYSAANVLPAADRLVEGARVVVFHAAPALPVRATLAVQTVRVESPAAANGTALRLTGPVERFAALSDFTVRGQQVDASAARWSGSTPASGLRVDSIVRLTGVVRDGVLRAEQARVLVPGEDETLSVRGMISGFTDNGRSFRIRGALLTVDTPTRFAQGDVTNLSNGVEVAVQGRIKEGLLLALQITLLDPPRVVAGTVSALATDSFRLLPQQRPIRVTLATRFRGGTAADLANGRRVRVSGQVVGEQFEAREVVFLNARGLPAEVLLIGAVSLQGATAFSINETAVQFDASTQFVGGRTGSAADLANGVTAIVRSMPGANGLLATVVDLRPGANETNSLHGYVSTFGSLAEFRAGNQRVNAAGATINGGAVAEGAYVFVEGEAAGGVFTARRVDVLPN